MLLKLSELSKCTGIPLRTLRYWATVRRFPVTQFDRLILVDPDEFAAWFDARCKASEEARRSTPK